MLHKRYKQLPTLILDQTLKKYTVIMSVIT